MSSLSKPIVIIASLQIQTSYHAVPLGAACIVSSLKADAKTAGNTDIFLSDSSLEDADFAGHSVEEQGKIYAEKIALLCGNGRAADIPAIVGFSVYVWNRHIFERAAGHLRSLVPGIVLFAGGPEVTANPRSFDVPSSFDYLVCGEGEIASVSLVRSILDGTPVSSDIAQFSFCSSKDPALLQSPWLDGTLSSSVAVRDCKGALWELARGCPYNCAYCYESKGKKKVQAFPLDRLEKELSFFIGNGIERIFVLDPTYNASRERALLILRLIEQKAGMLHFNFEVRAEHLDREMVKAFGKIPCSLQIGLQSSNPEALKLVNRNIDLSLFKKKISMLNEAGIVFGLDLIFGLPGDTLSTFRSSIDYAVSLYPNNLEIFRLAVLQGTILYDKADSLGLKFQSNPPYHIESTPKFPCQDIERAGAIARACNIFYTQGRAVTWFLSALHPIKLKSAQFFQDFALFIADNATQKKYPFLCEGHSEIPQFDAQKLQLAFTEKKYREKEKGFLWPLLCDIIKLNGAWTRALAEKEETTLSLSYHPDDLFSPDATNLEYFADNAYIKHCTVRIFSSPEGPQMEIK